MSISKKLPLAITLSLAVGTSLGLTHVANAADFGGLGFHSGGGGIGGFHGGLAADEDRDGGGFRARGFGRAERGFHDGVADRAAQFRDWQNGAWIGIGPDYYGDPYGSYWSYYCNPESPYFDPGGCGGY